MGGKISIVVPAYNLQDCLGSTLDSILAQTYGNLEVIVVNDGSADGTGAVIDRYALRDNRIKAVHKENGGVTSARLRGVAEATGQYVGFVDGDDYIEPQMYERLLHNLEETGADISHCGYRMVFPNGRVDYYYNTGNSVLQNGTQGCADLLDGKFVEPALVNKLYRRELFDGLTEWMDASIRINEDLLMNFFLFRQAKKAVYEDWCPYYYVLRKGSAATSKLNEHKLKDPLRVLRILMDETENVPEWHRIAERRMAYQLINTAALPLGNQRDLIFGVRQEARKELRSRISGILKGTVCDKKLKCMALLAAIWPAGYRLIHAAYAKARGTDKKYNIE